MSLTLEERVKSLEDRIQEMEDESSQCTLGQIIAILDHNLQNYGDMKLDFGFDNPHCYRGYYRDVAFGRVRIPQYITEAIKVFKSTIGRWFEGYKGGFFQMTEDTKVWISPSSYEDTGERFDVMTTVAWIDLSYARQHTDWDAYAINQDKLRSIANRGES
jgi:hypothetical protein